MGQRFILCKPTCPLRWSHCLNIIIHQQRRKDFDHHPLLCWRCPFTQLPLWLCMLIYGSYAFVQFCQGVWFKDRSPPALSTPSPSILRPLKHDLLSLMKEAAELSIFLNASKAAEMNGVTFALCTEHKLNLREDFFYIQIGVGWAGLGGNNALFLLLKITRSIW